MALFTFHGEVNPVKRSLLAFVLVSALAASAVAGPMGPVDPTARRIGVEFEASSDRRPMEWSGNANDHSDAKNINMLGRLSYGVTERVEIYARLGSSTLDVEDGPDATNAATSWFDGSRQFAYGGGFGAVLFGEDRWNLAFQANALVHERHTGTTRGSVAGTVNDYDYREWQAGLQVQGRFDRLLLAEPALLYVGVKYSDAQVQENLLNGVRVTPPDHDARENVGVYTGLSFGFGGSWRAYVEGRFIDETAVGGGVRFTY